MGIRRFGKRSGWLFLLLAGLVVTGAGLGERTAYGEEAAPRPILCYDFEGEEALSDKAGGSDLILHGKAAVRYVEERESQALYLPGSKGAYAELPQGFFDGRDEMTISMDVCTQRNDENFFTLAIGQDDTRYLFLRTRRGQIRYALTEHSYGSEQDTAALGDFYDVWVNVTLVLTKREMRLYLDGELADVQKGMTVCVSDLGTGLLAYLGRSFYSADAYFKGYIDNVIVYGEALSEMEIAALHGVSLNPFYGVTVDDWSLVTWQADAEQREQTAYISKSNAASEEEVCLSFRLRDHVEADAAGRLSVRFDRPSTMEFRIEEDGTRQTQEWTVRAVRCANPVLAGQYADPDIDVFDGTYYLYATTDGFSGWSGTKFHVFSSDDLVDWVDGGVILDVATDDVPWAVGSAWAPSIEEKNGKYYFYFCAKSPDGISSIGVAEADSPLGPFTAMAEPLITKAMCEKYNVAMGQAIDPSVFTEDDGTSYLLFGNGSAAVVRLNDDMVSVDLSTLQNYRGVKEFREAITVTKRNGVYHFTWSCDDTGSTDYHVNYGTSDSLYGPITYQYTLLEKRPESDILGTGHHCVLQIPGEDEYYIVYHRFFTPLGTFTEGLGFHRETCIDRLCFDEGTSLMLPVTPTLEGVAARTLRSAAGGSESDSAGPGTGAGDGDAEDTEASDPAGGQGGETAKPGKRGSAAASRAAGIVLAILLVLLLPLGVIGCRRAADNDGAGTGDPDAVGTAAPTETADPGDEAGQAPEEGSDAEERVYTDYFFAYFTGNGVGQEAISFAVSHDGFSWEALNNDRPVLVSDLGTCGVRDPFLMRSAEGDKFYLIATDLCIAADGDWWKAQSKGSTSIIFWESEDLVNWSEPRMLKVNSDSAGCTWAPEAFYDESTGEYLVFFSSRVARDGYGQQRVYYVKTQDFETFTEPEVWIDYGFDTIDATVIREGDVYYRFLKYEGEARVILERADSLLGEWTRVESPSLEAQEGVEGPCCFALNDDDVTDDCRYVLLLDNYGGKGYYMQITPSLESGEFTRKSGYSLPQKRPRHGTVIQITAQEYQTVVEGLGGRKRK